MREKIGIILRKPLLCHEVKVDSKWKSTKVIFLLSEDDDVKC